MMKYSTMTFIAGILLIIATITNGCVPPTDSTQPGKPKTVNELKAVEIKEYEGKKLSSVSDFRENSIRGPQYIKIDNYKLQVAGQVDNSKEFSYDEFLNNFDSYKKVVTLDCVEGWSATILWEGKLLKDVFADIVPSANASIVIFHSYDGYTTSLPLDYIMKNDIMLAHKMNDVILPAERGFPFTLVAESKWGYKWIKWVTKIELSDDVNYRGYWESRGYSNTADLDKGFFGD